MSLPEDIRALRVYYMTGGNYAASQAGFARSGYEIRTPPWGGWGTALIIGKPDAKRLLLFCPVTLASYTISPQASEIRNATPVDLSADRVEAMIKRRWDEALRNELPADFGTAALVLARLGRDVPTIASHAEYARQSGTDTDTEGTEVPRKRKNKAVADRLIAPVDPAKQIGKVLRWLMDNPGKSVKVVSIDLDIPPHSVRSALSILSNKHGIGIQYEGDGITATLPRGCTDPFITEKAA